METGGATGVIEAVGTAVTSIIGWSGDVLTAIMSGEMTALLPVFAIGIGVSVVLFGVKLVRKICWGA